MPCELTSRPSSPGNCCCSTAKVGCWRRRGRETRTWRGRSGPRNCSHRCGAVDIRLTEERFADARALNRAHPGANPLWWVRTDPWRAVLGIALGVIIVAVIAAVVRLA
jgi:hypothetical protein